MNQFNVKKRSVKTNQDIIGEQCISDNDGVLVCSETFKKIVSMGW